ncbi:MAG: S-layer homology domain-containing protein [Firmicutes bacterium]|nr:S-layer homology domain-containing protein [Bacillota bacterium]
MKKQRKRIYTALLCTCFLFSTASVPVSAAETEQEEMTTLSNRSGEAEVSAAADLASALGDSNISKITLKQDIAISDTLTVNRAVTLDLNGFVLQRTGNDSVIKVEQDGNLTIADSNTDKEHKFFQHSNGLWVLVDDGIKTVKGGIITGGKAQKGGGVYVAPGGKLHMTGGSIVGCQAKDGGGVYLDDDSQTDASSEFTMTDSSIIGCTASYLGGGVAVNPKCKFTMDNGSAVRSCTARNGGGVYITSSANGNGVFTLRNGAILSCTADSWGGGVFNAGAFIMESGTIKGCTAGGDWSSGGGVFNRREFTMRGGRIGEDKTDESHVYNAADTAAVFTISDTAKIYTNVANDSRLNADGGEIFGDVTNAINSRYGAVIAGTEGVAGSTEFSGAVINNEAGTIAGGVFTGSVTNNLGTILGGDFSQAEPLSGKLVITFDPNNGDNMQVDWKKEGVLLKAPTSEPTKEGYTFEGWYYENKKWNFETDKAKYTMTLTAQWKANTYTVTVENDGNGTASADPAFAKMGAEVSLTAMPNSGYHFKKWEVVSGDVEIENNKFTMPAADVTVKAIFERNASSGGGGGGGTTYYTLTFETNGGGSMQAIRAARGKTLDLSAYTPMRDGYDFGGWYADKDLTQRITEIKLSGSKTVYADWKKREPDAVKNPFADVNAGDWFYRDVLFSYEKGLMSGMDAAAFAPYANTTRAQIAVIFYRMEGSPAVEGENSFTDVVRGSGTAWFYDAVTWAQQNGIMGGYDNSSFAPKDPITREQLAAIFYRYAQYKGYDTTQGGMAIREFGDYESISDYAMSAMAWAVNTGLVKGDSNLLYPNGTATRAEIAAMLHRFVENGMK